MPQPGFHCRIVSCLQSSIECGVNIDQPAQMDVMSEFVDQNAFSFIRVADVSQYVFFRDRAVRIFFAPSETTCSGIPEILCRDGVKIAYFFLRQSSEFGEVGRIFVVRHDAHAGSALDHGLANIRPFCEHHIDQKGRFLESVGIHCG